MARFKCYLDSLCPHKKIIIIKTLSELGKTFWMLAYINEAHVVPRIVHED